MARKCEVLPPTTLLFCDHMLVFYVRNVRPIFWILVFYIFVILTFFFVILDIFISN